MQFIVKREVLDLGLKTLGIVITDIDNKTKSEDFLNFKTKANEALKEKYKNFDIETDFILKGFNELHKKIGIKRRKNTPIGESILKQFLKNDKLLEKSKLMDLYNIVTLDSRLSIAIYDIDKIEGDVTLKILEKNQTFLSVDNEERIANKGEYVYSDNKNIIYRLEVEQSNKAIITENTKNTFITIEGNEATSNEYLMEVASEIIELITRYCGGDADIIYK